MQSINSIVTHIRDLLVEEKLYEAFQQLESIQFRCMRRFGLQETLKLLTDSFELFAKQSDVILSKIFLTFLVKISN